MRPLHTHQGHPHPSINREKILSFNISPFYKPSKQVRKAVFPIAGLGTRFLPATKAMAKEMLPIVDRPLIQYAVEEAAAAGIEEIIFVTHRSKRCIEDYLYRAVELESELALHDKHALLRMLQRLTPRDIRFSFVRQEEPRGLGHAIHCARYLIGDEPFAVLLPDDLIDSQPPVLAQMIAQYERIPTSLVAIRSVPWKDTRYYGIVNILDKDQNGCSARIRNVVEKPSPEAAPSTMAIVGRYIFTPAIFKCLENLKPGVGNEIQLTDGITQLLKLEPVMTYRYHGQHYDCGSKVGFLEATVAYGLQHPEVAGEFREVLLRAAAQLAGEDRNQDQSQSDQLEMTEARIRD